MHNFGKFLNIVNDKFSHYIINNFFDKFPKLNTRYQSNFYNFSLLFSLNYQTIDINLKNIIFLNNNSNNKILNLYKNFYSRFFYIKNKLVLPTLPTLNFLSILKPYKYKNV